MARNGSLRTHPNVALETSAAQDTQKAFSTCPQLVQTCKLEKGNLDGTTLVIAEVRLEFMHGIE